MIPAANHRENTERFRANQRRLGRCLFCREKPQAGYVLCQACLDKQKAYVKRRTQARIEAGLCTRCGGPRRPRYFKMCEPCRKKSRKRSQSQSN